MSIAGKLKINKLKSIIKFYVLFLTFFYMFNYFGDCLITPTSVFSYFLIKLLIPSAKLQKNLIILPNATVEVVKECVGSFLIAGFLALTITYSKKIKDLLIGLFIVFLSYLINIIRISAICYFSNMYPKDSQLYHDIIGYLIILTATPILTLLYFKLISE
ncbi:MAG: archaeosortase family protein ArtE [Methanococci archaeon]|nr:archaeosortase family protein ArtE [Methanococci archaeon]